MFYVKSKANPFGEGPFDTLEDAIAHVAARLRSGVELSPETRIIEAESDAGLAYSEPDGKRLGAAAANLVRAAEVVAASGKLISARVVADVGRGVLAALGLIDPSHLEPLGEQVRAEIASKRAKPEAASVEPEEPTRG